jgi:hypothetical protein
MKWMDEIKSTHALGQTNVDLNAFWNHAQELPIISGDHFKKNETAPKFLKKITLTAQNIQKLNVLRGFPSASFRHTSSLANHPSQPLSPSPRKFGALDESTLACLWRKPGKFTAIFPSGAKQFDLGNGIFRIDRPNGSQTLGGILLDGKKVAYEQSGNAEWWHVEMQSTSKKIEGDAVTKVVGKQPPQAEGRLNLGNQEVGFRQFFPSTTGAQLSLLKFPQWPLPNQIFQIFSDKPLSLNELSTLGQVMLEMPSVAFKHTHQIFVLEKIGETRKKGERAKGIAGLADMGSGMIFIEKSHLSSLDKCRHVLYHEAGHVLDSHTENRKNISATAKDENGSKIFGNRVVKNNNGEIDLQKCGYVSEYATLNPLEDFAETHRYVMNLRRYFNERTPNIEFFSLSKEALNSLLARKGIPIPLQKKIQTIAKIYREKIGANGLEKTS